MNKMEYRVDAKIIKQLSLFLMLHGVTDFDLSFKIDERSSVIFTIVSRNITDEIADHMKEKINREREIEVEVYGWELLGDTDSQNELDIVGSLIDEIKVDKSGGMTTVTMKRIYPYNKV